jgi:hypothetical protein
MDRRARFSQIEAFASRRLAGDPSAGMAQETAAATPLGGA